MNNALRAMVTQRLGFDPVPFMESYRKRHPEIEPEKSRELTLESIPAERRVLGYSRAAALIGCSVDALYRMRNAVPHVRVNGRVVIFDRAVLPIDTAQRS